MKWLCCAMTIRECLHWTIFCNLQWSKRSILTWASDTLWQIEPQQHSKNNPFLLRWCFICYTSLILWRKKKSIILKYIHCWTKYQTDGGHSLCFARIHLTSNIKFTVFILGSMLLGQVSTDFKTCSFLKF